MLDVIVSTVDERRQPTGLQYIEEPFRLLVDTRPGWAASVNALLDQSRGDVLQIDDDVELLPNSLDLVKLYYDSADIFGIGLIAPNGPHGWYVQSAGHMLAPIDGGVMLQPFSAFATSVPCLVAHAGASCLYIKRRVVEAGIRFPSDWAGVHHEDVAFCLAAWLADFRVARLPSYAIHYTHPIGAGVTKATQPGFQEGRAKNEQALAAWMKERGIAEAAASGRIPLGVLQLDGSPWTLEGLAR